MTLMAPTNAPRPGLVDPFYKDRPTTYHDLREKALERILDRSHATLVGRAWDIHTLDSREGFKDWMLNWYDALSEEMNSDW